jgi:hypothetical protein
LFIVYSVFIINVNMTSIYCSAFKFVNSAVPSKSKYKSISISTLTRMEGLATDQFHHSR